jgi:hypothetical protein
MCWLLSLRRGVAVSFDPSIVVLETVPCFVLLTPSVIRLQDSRPYLGNPRQRLCPRIQRRDRQGRRRS